MRPIHHGSKPAAAVETAAVLLLAIRLEMVQSSGCTAGRQPPRACILGLGVCPTCALQMAAVALSWQGTAVAKGLRVRYLRGVFRCHVQLDWRGRLVKEPEVHHK